MKKGHPKESRAEEPQESPVEHPGEWPGVLIATMPFPSKEEMERIKKSSLAEQLRKEGRLLVVTEHIGPTGKESVVIMGAAFA